MGGGEGGGAAEGVWEGCWVGLRCVSEDAGDEPEPALAGEGAGDARVEGFLGWWEPRDWRGGDETFCQGVELG